MFNFLLFTILLTIAGVSLECNAARISDQSHRIKRQLGSEATNENACSVPKLENGGFHYPTGKVQYFYADPPPNFLVSVHCDKNYVLNTTYAHLYCVNGKFEKELPKCVLACPAIKTSTSVDVQCKLNGVEHDCFKEVPEGTIASMKCKPNFLELNPGSSTAACLNGSWDVQEKQCISGCREGQFVCNNGQCIPIHNYCDGKSDCSDESDEALNCNTNGCSSDKFICTYGACINGDLKCDGKQDCRDNSDEDAKICEHLLSDGKCPSPVIENGKYEVLGNPKHVPGDPIPNYNILNLTCINNKYTLTTTNNFAYCINGNFHSKLPKCVLSCAARFSTSIDVECEFNGVKRDCSKRVPQGTIASMKCKTHYEENIRGPSTAICLDGYWDLPIKKCSPECGVLVPKAQTLIVNGTAAKRGEFPWHVAIYRQIYRQELQEPPSYYCGGSIISVKLVLSVAHCFATLNDGNLFPTSEFSVAAGKYFSKWDAPEDKDFVQKRKVSKIEYKNDIYLGEKSKYAGNIAVVVVDKPFVLTNLIKPVCVDWDSDYVDKHLRNGTLGQVAGWGFTSTEYSVVSVDLKQITAPFIDRGQCLEIVPQDFKQYIQMDKYCAGYTNGTSICDGDSGGGMVFLQETFKGKKYYIQGIVGFGPRKDGACDDHQITVYTKVYNYIQFIKIIELSNQIY